MNKKSVTTSYVLPVEMKQLIDEIAKREECSQSRIAKMAFKAYILAYKQKLQEG